jgi:hypothetical protein
MVEQAHAKVTESRMGVMAEQGEVCLDDRVHVWRSTPITKEEWHTRICGSHLTPSSMVSLIDSFQYHLVF